MVAPRPIKPASPGSVRIVSGQWRGTRLPVADAAGLRPTPDRVRETLFNWLQGRLPGASVLDLFAGSGALGLEAVSRGARDAVLVERDPRLAESLRATVARLRAGDRVEIACADALAWLRGQPRRAFDIVFLDPPYTAGLWESALAALGPWLAQDAWLYLESPADAPTRPGADWLPYREGSTRESHYALFCRAAAEHGRGPVRTDTLPPES